MDGIETDMNQNIKKTNLKLKLKKKMVCAFKAVKKAKAQIIISCKTINKQNTQIELSFD